MFGGFFHFITFKNIFARRKRFILNLKEEIFIFENFNSKNTELKQHNNRMVKLLLYAMQEELSDDRRDVLIRRMINGESITSIAESRNSSRTTVYRLLEDSQQILRDRLKYAVAYSELMANEECSGEHEGPNFAEQVKAMRQKKLLSAAQLSDILGVKPQELEAVESGKNIDNITLNIKLATFLGISVI